MSGFGIIIRWADEPAPERVDLLRSGIEHRGPDGVATEQVGRAVLVHAQFATTPEALRERQPTRHVRRDWWITADARIDNRDELRVLLADRVEHPLDTDIDFVLAAYERWGDELAEHLLGDFAFAIWDAERSRLLLVRDHVGIRPLLWALTNDGGFVASSVLRATLEASGQPRDFDPVYLADYATFGGRVIDRSPWAGISRLPGGHCLSVGLDEPARVWRYWSPPDSYRETTVEEAAEAVRDAFEQAVACRLRAPAPIGVQLSGGFDSTSVAAMAASLINTEQLRAYALVFPGEDCDESEYIDAAVDHIGLTCHKFDALAVEPFDFAGYCQRTLDVPLLPDNQWMTPMNETAAADGCRVVLTGQGGDHALHGSLAAVASHLLSQRSLRDAWGLLAEQGWSRNARSKRLVMSALSAHAESHPARLTGHGAARLLRYRRRQQATRSLRQAEELLGPVLQQQLSTLVMFDDPTSFDRDRPGTSSHYSGGMNYFVELWDHTATSGGVECRHPFFDVRLIEVVVGLREHVVADRYQSRGLHRRALDGLLPEKTLNRPDKAEFSGPWTQAALGPARAASSLVELDGHGIVRRGKTASLTAKLGSSIRSNNAPWPWWGALGVLLLEQAAMS